jgi:hypothetical protein
MKKITLKGYYQQLKESNPQKEFREKVMAATGISYPMFYNYVNGRWPVPDIHKQAFADAAKCSVDDLFPKFTYQY